MSVFPELEQLKKMLLEFSINISVIDTPIDHTGQWVLFTVKEKSWKILLDDEYGDFSINSPIMNLFLVLNTLETYAESADFLVWTRSQVLDPNTPLLLNYYRSLGAVCREIELAIGDLTCPVPYEDYTMRTPLGLALISSKSTKKD